MGFIYKITNKINQKVYIGKTTKTVLSRWKEHCCDYKKPRNEKRPLYDAMCKYGLENFYVEEIEECDDSCLEEREQFWIKTYNSYIGFANSNGYNATLGGDGKIIKDEKKILQVFNQTQDTNLTAAECNTSPETVRKILHNNGIEKTRVFINPVKMWDLKTGVLIKEFQNQSEAARWIQEQGLTVSTDYKKVSYILGRAIRDRNGIAYGYKWTKQD